MPKYLDLFGISVSQRTHDLIHILRANCVRLKYSAKHDDKYSGFDYGTHAFPSGGMKCGEIGHDKDGPTLGFKAGLWGYSC
jgi:hypothetical protein